MKDELVKVLNSKLDDINTDIDSLVELNEKIKTEEDKLSYVSQILDLFKDNGQNNIMSFAKLSKDDFDKVLAMLDTDVRDIFSSPSCNYDGLVYLINGINDGVSIELTDEQKNGIEYLINKLGEKKTEHTTAIEGYDLIKKRYLISDVNELKNKKENYLNVLDRLNNNQYIGDTDLLLESMKFSDLSNEEIINILKYLLEYNANVHTYDKPAPKYESYDKSETTFNEEVVSPIGSVPDSYVLEEENKDELNSVNETPESEEYQEIKFDDNEENEFTSFSAPYFDNLDIDNTESNENEYIPVVEPPVEDIKNDSLADAFDSIELEDNKELDNTSNEESETEESEYELDSEEPISTGDLKSLLGKYNIQEDNTLVNELVVGDVKNYEDVLDVLSDNNLVDSFKNNKELMAETLLYSNGHTIKEVLKIIKNDLSVDEDDYKFTVKLAILSIPSAFISQGGNYNNFIENVKTFKELDLNLINLFDFSKELFVASHNTIVNNLEIVKKYDVNITCQNAKYLLLLPNIGDRLDYYVESVYEDKEKHETFDGIEYINEYTAKLNVVTDETIKRLRFCSENGKKVFGNKPKSLTGEITNLKVNSLDISSDYYNKFFNNEFAILTGDEVREYTKLIHNSSNVGNYDDELDILEQFHTGIRYVIEGINVSYNKVLRNYSILRSYGIDIKKALHFAVCYNLVITKDEYEKLAKVLDELGGNN